MPATAAPSHAPSHLTAPRLTVPSRTRPDRTLTEGSDDARKVARRGNPNPPKLPKRRLTKELIKGLPAPDRGYIVPWDAGVAGLGIRIMPSGRRVWFWQHRRQVTIGRADLVSPEQARKRAQEYAAETELGGDPSARIKAAKLAKRAKLEKMPDHRMNQLWRLYSAGDLMEAETVHANAYARSGGVTSSRASAIPTSPRSPAKCWRRCTARSPPGPASTPRTGRWH